MRRIDELPLERASAEARIWQADRGRWGIEQLATAIPKGRDQGMAYMRDFVEDTNDKGLVTRAVERAGLRGTVKTNSH